MTTAPQFSLESIVASQDTPTVQTVAKPTWKTSLTIAEVNSLQTSLQYLLEQHKQLMQATKEQTVREALELMERTSAALLRRIQALRQGDR